MILAELYLIICTLFLAGKDATSYLLKDRLSQSTDLTIKRIQRWHRDGVVLFGLFVLPLLFIVSPVVILYAGLIRLIFFDIAFNKWANLPIKFLGSTSKFDLFFKKYLGEDGAIKKALIFLGILILLNFII